MVEGFSSLAERIQHAFIWILVAIVSVLGAIYAYWCLGDRTPPIKDAELGLVEYNAAGNYMWIDFSAIKVREEHCTGIRYQGISEPGDEPPTRRRIALDPVTLPPQDFNGVAASIGQRGHWVRLIMLPAIRPMPFNFNAEWAFTCNPAQHDDRVITVKAKPLLVQ